ncbi:hypothetical protein CA12_07600 [Alienimonas californiensis]|uniref:Methyltransferase FkbM domain-containing protein n=2 Tax=Alienimonas californiensis TaxID=2527989 RepID=A0A517P5N6_9PLAN|nr:hypothetical protein CA12_07600 [Alienimonas californiensis]
MRSRALARLASNRHGLSHRELLTLQSGRSSVAPSVDPERVRATIQSLRPYAVDGAELIRLGPATDGGYLVPDDLEGIVACYSPGVCSESGFERDCADRDMAVFLADASVGGPATAHPRFRFVKKFVGPVPSEQVVTLEGWVNDTADDLRTLSEQVGADPAGDLMLQMDIEGAEYTTLLAAPDALMRRFRVIVLELHDVDHIFSESFYRIFDGFVAKLLHTHLCVHVHPNNNMREFRKFGLTLPNCCEITLLRRDRAASTRPVTALPHPLDVDCVASAPSIGLDPAWLGQ